jgi:hypothetical protein
MQDADVVARIEVAAGRVADLDKQIGPSARKISAVLAMANQ